MTAGIVVLCGSDAEGRHLAQFLRETGIQVQVSIDPPTYQRKELEHLAMLESVKQVHAYEKTNAGPWFRRFEKRKRK